jgi:hypothetical protein
LGISGHWVIYENSSSPVLDTGIVASANDVARIEYDGTTITYKLNGVVKRTVTNAGLTLYGVVYLYWANSSGVNGLNYGPGTATYLVDTPEINDNAASQIVSTTQTSASTYGLFSANNTDVLNATVQCTGVPIGIDVTASVSVAQERANFGSPMTLYITRDGSTQVGVATFDLYDWLINTTPVGGPIVGYITQVTLVANDAPSAGSHTYGLHINTAAGATTGSPTLLNISLTNIVVKVREYKR